MSGGAPAQLIIIIFGIVWDLADEITHAKLCIDRFVSDLEYVKIWGIQQETALVLTNYHCVALSRSHCDVNISFRRSRPAIACNARDRSISATALIFLFLSRNIINVGGRLIKLTLK